jgi:uncharacterized protein YycO
MIESHLLRGFVDELVKLAEHPVFDKKIHIQEKLRPGDILYTEPKTIDKWHHRLFYAIEKRFQGSPNTHVGIYVGNGNVVDAGAWQDKDGDFKPMVYKVPLRKYTDRYNFKVLRVDAPASVKNEAVEFAKDQVGKDFNMRGMFRLALPFKGAPSEADRVRQSEAKSFFCSELVANAYSKLDIAPDKKLKHVMPADFANSPLTKTVAEYRTTPATGR